MMPLHVGNTSFPATISDNHVNRIARSDTPVEISIWKKIEGFFCSTRKPEALKCIQQICHLPPGTKREDVADSFEQLWTLAYSGSKVNIQFDRHGENHFCILDANGQEMLSVTSDEAGEYSVKMQGYNETRESTPHTLNLSDREEIVSHGWKGNGAPGNSWQPRTTLSPTINPNQTVQGGTFIQFADDPTEPLALNQLTLNSDARVKRNNEAKQNCNTSDLSDKLRYYSDEFFRLRSEDKTSIFNNLENIVTKAKTNNTISSDEVLKAKTLVRHLITKESEALNQLNQYNKIVEDSKGVIENFWWENKEYNYKETNKRLNEDITTKKSQVDNMEKICDVFQDANLTNNEKVILLRAELRFMNALTLTLYSDYVSAARFNVMSLGKLIGYDTEDLTTVPNDAKRAFSQEHFFPEIKKIVIGSLNNQNTSASFRNRLKEDIVNIAREIKKEYSMLDNSQNDKLDSLVNALK